MDLFNHGTLQSFATGTGIMAIFAAVMAGWQKIKSLSGYVMSALILQRTVLSYGLNTQVREHLRGSYRKIPSGIAKFNHLKLQVDDRSMLSLVPFEIPHSVGLWRGKRGIFFVLATDSITKLLSLRWLSNPQGLIVDALEAEEARRDIYNQLISANRYRVVPIMGSVGEGFDMHMMQPGNSRLQLATRSADEDMAPPSDEGSGSWWNPMVHVDESFMYKKYRYAQENNKLNPLRGLFYPPDVLSALDSCKQWYQQREWYEAHSIPWRTGLLLWGPGGTGKSSLARVTAQTLDLPLYQWYLNTLNDRDFVTKWDDMETPCVVALEDFDTVFHGRESTTVHKSLSFECVLNKISGISSLNGVLLIVTTNHIDNIDPALGRIDENGRPTRPGRIDQILYMGATTTQQRRDIATYTLDSVPKEVIEDLVREHDDSTAAQFQSICITLALETQSQKRNVALNGGCHDTRNQCQ